MEPLLITAQTPHGVVLADPWGIALDGLLAGVIWHRHQFAARAAGTPWRRFSALDEPELVELPLRTCGTPGLDEDWHWMCTFAELHPHSPEPDTRWRVSRTDHARLQQLSPSISVQRVSDTRGRYRRRALPILAHTATHLTWRAIGDADEIAELLEDLPAIGKNTGSGEGVVSSWAVSPTPDVATWDAGHAHSPDALGRATPPRCLDLPGAPAAEVIKERHELRRTGVRAPYLHPSTRIPAFLPHH